MKKNWSKHKWVSLLFLCLSLYLQLAIVSPQSLPADQDYEEFANTRTFRGEASDMPEVHCSRERSKAAWKVIDEYLMPYVEKERYQIPRTCRLHPENDLFRDQEQHKIRIDVYEWQCGYCKKRFYEEKFLDKHFENRHHNLLNVVLLHKTKCNPAAAARNKHLCEGLADSCFPVNQGPSANCLHEFFLRQFCDALTCAGRQKPFSQGRRKDKITAAKEKFGREIRVFETTAPSSHNVESNTGGTDAETEVPLKPAPSRRLLVGDLSSEERRVLVDNPKSLCMQFDLSLLVDEEGIFIVPRNSTLHLERLHIHKHDQRVGVSTIREIIP